MRRSFSISLLFLFLLGPVLSALPGVNEANLPMCCRRHGAHHCVMGSEGGIASGEVILRAASHCSSYCSLAPAVIPAFVIKEQPHLASIEQSAALPSPFTPSLRNRTLSCDNRGPPTFA